jgi:hypothetical protein
MIGNCSCGREWASAREAHCRVCHAHFSTAENFDRHKPDRHGCPDPGSHRDSLRRPVLKRIQRPGGYTWVRYDERPDPRRSPHPARVTSAAAQPPTDPTP